jgi:hypothetical protein
MVPCHDYIIPSPVHIKFPAETVVDVGDELHIFGTMRWCRGWFYAQKIACEFSHHLFEIR